MCGLIIEAPTLILVYLSAAVPLLTGVTSDWDMSGVLAAAALPTCLASSCLAETMHSLLLLRPC